MYLSLSLRPAQPSRPCMMHMCTNRFIGRPPRAKFFGGPTAQGPMVFSPGAGLSRQRRVCRPSGRPRRPHMLGWPLAATQPIEKRVPKLYFGGSKRPLPSGKLIT